MSEGARREERVLLLDVDNTLLDNDRFGADLREHLAARFGATGRDRYWAGFAALRAETGYADYLAALQRFRSGLENDPELLRLSSWLLDYPFAQLLYPRSLEAIEHLRTLGTPVILSDGEVVFQPRKIQRSGLWDALQGAVLIYHHKELALDGMTKRYPAAHYVMVDDKPQLLVGMKKTLGTRLTTIWVQQGKYAAAALAESGSRPVVADISMGSIGELCDLSASSFTAA